MRRATVRRSLPPGTGGPFLFLLGEGALGRQGRVGTAAGRPTDGAPRSQAWWGRDAVDHHPETGLNSAVFSVLRPTHHFAQLVPPLPDGTWSLSGSRSIAPRQRGGSHETQSDRAAAQLAFTNHPLRSHPSNTHPTAAKPERSGTFEQQALPYGLPGQEISLDQATPDRSNTKHPTRILFQHGIESSPGYPPQNSAQFHADSSTI